tara:strand:+ start:1343 stop:1546 length:204 start_codon:yes stop_codon:yes gene_type:complete
LIRDCHQRNQGAMIQIPLAPYSPFSVTTYPMRETAKISECENVMIHSYLCETLDEEDFRMEKFNSDY